MKLLNLDGQMPQTEDRASTVTNLQYRHQTTLEISRKCTCMYQIRRLTKRPQKSGEKTCVTRKTQVEQNSTFEYTEKLHSNIALGEATEFNLEEKKKSLSP